MKIQVLKEKTFQPIKIEVVIESEQELCDLWHRLNVSATFINDESDDLKLKCKVGTSDTLWKDLNTLVKDLGLKK